MLGYPHLKIKIEYLLKKELRQYEDLKKSFTNAGGNPEDFPEFETEKKYKPYLLQYHMQPSAMTPSMKQAIIPACILDAYDDYIETYADVQQTYEKIDNFITTLGNGDFSAGFNKLPTDIQNRVITIHSEKLILEYSQAKNDATKSKIQQEIEELIRQAGNGDFSAGFANIPDDTLNKINEIFFPS